MGCIFDAYTLTQAIRRAGVDVEVTRPAKNEFGEPAGETLVGTLRGLWHTSSGFLDVTLQDGAKLYDRKYPMLLVAYTDAVQPEDIITRAGHRYNVTGVDDVGGLRLCVDISLREEGT